MNLRVPVTRIADIAAERRAISSDTALRLARYFKTSPQFSMNWQVTYDLDLAEDKDLDPIEHDVRSCEPTAKASCAKANTFLRAMHLERAYHAADR
jgi:plasmid maintenance system antidote protein VapI